jgi:hypothetical protein
MCKLSSRRESKAQTDDEWEQTAKVNIWTKKHIYQVEKTCKMWRLAICTIHHGNGKSGITELSTSHVRDWLSEIQAENESVSTERIEVCRSASTWNFRTRLYELSGSTNYVPTY